MAATKTRAAHSRSSVGRRTAARVASQKRRHVRVRKKVEGSQSRPRLAVTRSSKNIFAQLIDDVAGNTLASASTLDESIRGTEGDKTAKAKQVGALLAERARQAGITAAVFDRGGHAYHGRIAALADGAREGGLAL